MGITETSGNKLEIGQSSYTDLFEYVPSLALIYHIKVMSSKRYLGFSSSKKNLFQVRKHR